MNHVIGAEDASVLPFSYVFLVDLEGGGRRNP